MATKIKDTRTITVEPLSPVIGAEVKGVDLSRELDAETTGQIIDAWHRHAVLLFRDQEISGDDQLRFAALFGPVAERVTPPAGATRPDAPDWTNLMLVTDHVDENGKPIGSLGHGDMWFHSDKCYRKRPHRVSFLYGVEIPTEGGHTRFSSLYAAYDNIPDDLKRRLDGAMVMQGYDYGTTERLNLDVDLDDILHCRQPVFVTNPGSGRKALYVSRLNTMWIEGMTRDESEDVLNRLFDLTEDPAIIYEHVWRPGDIIVWDNLACLHARTDWPADQGRLLRRCTVEGDPLY
jgi:taurine dioxygenase